MTADRSYAHYSDGFGVKYTCERGYSFNQKKANDITWTVHCMANGLLETVRGKCRGLCLSLITK